MSQKLAERIAAPTPLAGENRGAIPLFGQANAFRPIWQQTHFARSGARNPDPHRKEHEQNEQAHDLQGMAPTEVWRIKK